MSFGERRKTQNRDNNGSRGGLKICSFFWKPRKTWRHFFFSFVPLLSGHSFYFFSFSGCCLLSPARFRPSLVVTLFLSSPLPWNFSFNPHTHLCTKLLTNHPWKILTILLVRERRRGVRKEEVCREREEKRSWRLKEKARDFSLCDWRTKQLPRSNVTQLIFFVLFHFICKLLLLFSWMYTQVCTFLFFCPSHSFALFFHSLLVFHSILPCLVSQDIRRRTFLSFLLFLSFPSFLVVLSSFSFKGSSYSWSLFLILFTEPSSRELLFVCQKDHEKRRERREREETRQKVKEGMRETVVENVVSPEKRETGGEMSVFAKRILRLEWQYRDFNDNPSHWQRITRKG